VVVVVREEKNEIGRGGGFKSSIEQAGRSWVGRDEEDGMEWNG